MRICELKNKQVINSCDCKILGNIMDIDFNICTGVINSIIVPGPAKLCGFLGHETEYIIPFECIKCIGQDVVLVEADIERITHKCQT